MLNPQHTTTDFKTGLEVQLLSGEAFLYYWPKISEMWDSLPHTWGNLTKDSIFARALSDSIQVWGVGGHEHRMILFTQIACHASGRVLEIIWAAGEGMLPA